MEKNSTDAIQQTLEYWQGYSKEPLSTEDAREIITNLEGVFSTLARWKRERDNAEEKIPPESH